MNDRSGTEVGSTSLAHRVEFGLFLGVRRLVLWVPERMASRFAAFLGLVAGSVLRIRRRAVDHHLACAFPEWDRRVRDRVARESYRHLGREAMVLFRMGVWSPERVVRCTEVEGLDGVRRALDESGGALLLSGHIGNWEVGAAALAARGLPIEVVAKGMANRAFERELFGARERLGMRVVEMSEAPREVLRALRRGSAVAIVGDQNAHRNGVFVPFFGRLAATARGPGMFALRTGVPVFVSFSIRLPGSIPRYRVTFERLHFEPEGDLERDIQRFTAVYVAKVEDVVRAHPTQYLWQHKRWKTRPPEEPPKNPSVENARSNRSARNLS